MGCNLPGSEVRLSPASNPKRKTQYTWELIRLPATWVGINTHLTNHLVAEALEQHIIAELSPQDEVHREVRLGAHSRIDFLLRRGQLSLYLEAKNITLVEDGIAYFPDAVTDRGRKHLRSLVEAIEDGHQAAICYVIQREDAAVFAPAAHIDPMYAKELRRAHACGMQILAYQARVTPEEIKLTVPVPVDLGISVSSR